MPVGVDKVHPFLAAVTAGRTVKEFIGSGIGLIQKGNEVVFHGSFLVHIKTELPVHCFELVACFIHASILLQFCPAVKSITGDFFRIRFICLWSTERVIPEIPDQDGIDSADKDAGIREPVGNRFIVSLPVCSMQTLVSPSRLLICSIRALIADWVWGMPQSRIRDPYVRFNGRGEILLSLYPIVRARPCFHCEVFRVPKNGALKTNKPPAMQVSQHCFSLQQKNLQ